MCIAQIYVSAVKNNPAKHFLGASNESYRLRYKISSVTLISRKSLSRHSNQFNKYHPYVSST